MKIVSQARQGFPGASRRGSQNCAKDHRCIPTFHRASLFSEFRVFLSLSVSAQTCILHCISCFNSCIRFVLPCNSHMTGAHAHLNRLSISDGLAEYEIGMRLSGIDTSICKCFSESMSKCSRTQGVFRLLYLILRCKEPTHQMGTDKCADSSLDVSVIALTVADSRKVMIMLCCRGPRISCILTHVPVLVRMYLQVL